MFFFHFPAAIVLGFSVCFSFFRWLFFAKRKLSGGAVVAFFHPNCADCGGGERVLWHAVQAVRCRWPDARVVVYTAASAPADALIVQQTVNRFGIQADDLKSVQFVRLRTHRLLDPARYPRLTLLLQSLAAAVVAVEALVLAGGPRPDVFVDTVGCAFTYPVARLCLVRWLVAYVHYPTVSADMLAVVRGRQPSFNNVNTVARSAVLSFLKLVYYHMFAQIYGCCGRMADVVMVNSTWTLNHVQQIWFRDDVKIVYPPCDVDSFAGIPLDRSREPIILSVGQFRPEKNHRLQIQAFARWIQSGSDDQVQVKRLYRLVCIGGCRSAADEARVRDLRDLAHSLGVSNRVDFLCNVSFAYLVSWLSRASIGIHTMVNEHFGIGIVEYQASGLVVVAHNSGGPKADLVEPGVTGFLATTAEQFARRLETAAALTERQRESITTKARLSSFRFSNQSFVSNFARQLKRIKI